ncbi:hypothetical protein JMJ35_003677 [Cladonia borealis]|uniref:Zn(2)-C6 fungal-type domain-containing protein n=1 Tax=Cladonia borealis TaxID=184061 RepID=A0AA39R344_9LECA|nr:hypothetical protein JMJ35_003677 [Cladonia borealis]
MSRSNSPDRLSNFRPASGIVKAQQRHQQLACDRCRGQKLRCIRTQNPQTSCERCQKAGATCVTRMGRPQRRDRGLPEATNHTRKAQPRHASNVPSLPGTSSSSASKDSTANGNTWLGHDLDETVHSNLVGVQHQESIDFGLHHAPLEDDQMHISPSEDCFDNTFDFVSPQVPRDLSDFGMYEFGNEETGGSLLPSSSMSMESIPISPIAAQEPDIEGIPEVTIQDDPPPMPQESVEKVSNLNLEVRRQLSIVRRMAKQYRNIESSLVESPDKNNSLSCVAAFMIQGLQTYHELLLEVLGSANQDSCKDTTSHTEMYNSQNNRPPLQHTFGPTTKPCPTNLLSLTDVGNADSMETIFEPKSKQQKVPRSSTSSKSHHIQDGPSHINFLDMSTSLLIISCYINLIQLCRDVFAAIRSALPGPCHQTTFLTLSGLQISGVPIHQDSDLQIIVLTQVVVRLVDKIGLSLGHPYNTTAEASKRDEAKFYSKAILPQLLEFVLRQEGVVRQPSCKVGIEALRAEIRKLNEVVYKMV